MMALLALVLAQTPLDAAPVDAAPVDAAAPVEAAPVDAPPVDTKTAAELAALRKRLDELEARVAADEHKPIRVPHLSVGDVKIRFGGYVDTGAFYAFGDGVAYDRDAGKVQAAQLHTRGFPWLIPVPERVLPDEGAVPWVFFGDPWANSVNADGDPASLGLDRTNIDRFDPIQSSGGFSFIVNTLNVDALVSAGDDLFVEASVNVLPRQGRLGSPGDLVDVDLAYVEWAALPELHLFAGKMESTFGREYRTRKAPDARTVTPSLMSRYTNGNPTGVKARLTLDSGLTVNAALTNGGMATEKFGHFYNEIDRNASPTASARVAYALSFGDGAAVVDAGVSGLVGPQDLQPQLDLVAWQIGADINATVSDAVVTAEYIRTFSPGGGVDAAPHVEADGFYATASWQLVEWAAPYARVDYRRAILVAQPNLYFSDVGRVAVGARFDITFNVIAKVEVLHVQEFTGPELDDDIVSSSLIFRL